VGAAIGAGIGSIISGIFGGPKEGTATHGPHGRPWSDDDLQTDVRAWWNDGMGGKFLSDYINSVDPRLFAASLEQLLPHYYAALYRAGKIPFWWLRDPRNTRDPRGYRPGLTEDAFRAIGMDFAATESGVLANPDNPSQWRWVPLAGRDLNAEAAAEALRIKAKEASGAPLTPTEQAAADRIGKEDKKGSGTVILILAGIVFAYLAFKR
jgi:hypothetical protein